MIRRIIVVAGFAVASLLTLVMTMGMGSASASTVPVQTGNTLSGIAAANGVSLGALESANPQFGNPNLIYTGQSVNLPGGGGPSVPATSSTPVTSTTPQPQSAPVSSGGGLSSVPGVPQSFASCVAFRESTDGQLSSNVYGIIPASGSNAGSGTLAQQKAAFSQLYAQYGTSPWAPYDGC